MVTTGPGGLNDPMPTVPGLSTHGYCGGEKGRLSDGRGEACFSLKRAPCPGHRLQPPGRFPGASSASVNTARATAKKSSDTFCEWVKAAVFNRKFLHAQKWPFGSTHSPSWPFLWASSVRKARVWRGKPLGSPANQTSSQSNPGQGAWPQRCRAVSAGPDLPRAELAQTPHLEMRAKAAPPPCVHFEGRSDARSLAHRTTR